MFFKFAHSFLDLVFPQKCLGCKELLPNDHHLLCPPCLGQMHFTDPADHCKQCYAYLETDICSRCFRSPSPFSQAFAPYCGNASALSLAQALTHPTGGFLAQSLASLMYVHMEHYAFQTGEWLIPASDEGSQRLAFALSHLLKTPVAEAIQPASLFCKTPQLKQKYQKQFEEQRLTYVTLGLRPLSDDIAEAFALAEAYPRSMNALMFSRALSR